MVGSGMEDSDVDDSDVDKDYVQEDGDSSDDEGSDSENLAIFKAPKKQPEIRVYMEPPVEKADGDTDRDSGKQIQYQLWFSYLEMDILQ